MVEEVCLDGKVICNGIKARAKACGITLLALMREAKVSIYTFRSWRRVRNPSFASLKRIYAVLERYESVITQQ